jgi:hypothetical protein
MFVDGGFDYFRCGGDFADMESVKISVDATKDELYQDWNRGIDKYGLQKTNNKVITKRVKKNVTENTKNTKTTKNANKDNKKNNNNIITTTKGRRNKVRKVSTRICKKP